LSPKLPNGAIPSSWFVPRAEGWEEIDGAVIAEKNVCIQVNGQVLARFMATPMELDALALGFLRSEGVISGLEDVAELHIGPSGICVDVWLHHSAHLPDDADAIRTAGCGGGVTFDDLEGFTPASFPDIHLTPDQLIARYYEMRAKEALYPITRGVHASALCTPDQMLLMAEDVGRHNTLDKLWGKAMQAGVSTRGRIIVTTGRISSEMLGKAAKMGAPVIASRTSPTSRSVALAQQWNITLGAYIRRGGFRVYAGVERLKD
jgi:FdhD protein